MLASKTDLMSSGGSSLTHFCCPCHDLPLRSCCMQLTDVWQSAAEALRSKLLKALGPEQCTELHIIGRSRKQKIMLAADHVTETMEVDGRTYEYMQVGSAASGLSWPVFPVVLLTAQVCKLNAVSRPHFLRLFLG